MTNIPSLSISPSQGAPNQPPSSPVALEPVAQPAVRAAAANAAQNPQQSAAAQSSEPQPSAEQIKRVTEALQNRATLASAELQFSIDDSSGKSIIKVVDRATKDVILQIPSEETLRIDKALNQYQQGLLINHET
jgi:flagellar protein FlaG